MAIAIGEVKAGFLADDTGNGTMIPLPPQNGGAVGWGTVFVSFGSDFADALLRVAIWNGGAWRISELNVPSAAGRVMLPIQDGDEKISVGRVKAGPKDAGTCPVAYLIETTLKA